MYEGKKRSSSFSQGDRRKSDSVLLDNSRASKKPSSQRDRRKSDSVLLDNSRASGEPSSTQQEPLTSRISAYSSNTERERENPATSSARSFSPNVPRQSSWLDNASLAINSSNVPQQTSCPNDGSSNEIELNELGNVSEETESEQQLQRRENPATSSRSNSVDEWENFRRSGFGSSNVVENIKLTDPRSMSEGTESEHQTQETFSQKINEAFVKVIKHIKDNNIYEALRVFGEALKPYENFADQAKYLGQSTSGDIQEAFCHNISSVADALITWYNQPSGEPAKFADLAAIIGFTREITKAVTNISTIAKYTADSSSLKGKYDKAKKEGKTQDRIDAVAKASVFLGEVCSTFTYPIIAGVKSAKGIKHHAESDGETNGFSGGLAAANTPMSIGADIGKVASSSLIFLGKLTLCINECAKSDSKKTLSEKIADGIEVNRAASGMVKDWAGLIQTINPGSPGSQDAQVVTAGYVAPLCVALSGIEKAYSAGIKIKQTYNNYKELKQESNQSDNLKKGAAHKFSDDEYSKLAEEGAAGKLNDSEYLELINKLDKDSIVSKETIDKIIPSVNLIIAFLQESTFTVSTGAINQGETEKALHTAVIMSGVMSFFTLILGGLLMTQKSKEKHLKELIKNRDTTGTNHGRIEELPDEPANSGRIEEIANAPA